MVTVCPSQFATRRTLFHVLVGCGLLMLKVSRLKLPVIWLLVSMWLNRSEERFSRNAETELVCRLLLEKKKARQQPAVGPPQLHDPDEGRLDPAVRRLRGRDLPDQLL